MPALPDFRFSAQSLQDYNDCQRRFMLRYIQKLDWPAEESSPYLEYEQFRQKGNLFHQCVNQYFHHLDPNIIEKQIIFEDVRSWWQEFLAFIETRSFSFSISETLFQTHLGGYAVAAKYDLLVSQQNGAYTIYDWKTTASDHRSGRKFYREKLQTILYPYVLSQCSFGSKRPSSIDPASITLTYWFPQFPAEPESFPYSSAQLEQDRSELEQTISEIVSKPTDDFAMTDNEKRCDYCVYRSYCGRGKKAGSMTSEDFDVEDFEGVLDLDIENVEEIRY